MVIAEIQELTHTKNVFWLLIVKMITINVYSIIVK